MSLYHAAVTTVSITSVNADSAIVEEDELSIEEPLEIAVESTFRGETTQRSIAVTMRTPGHDRELAAGFLLTEGIVQRPDQIVDIRTIGTNTLLVALDPQTEHDLSGLERHSFVSSSCGICGKRSIAAVFASKRHTLKAGHPKVESQIVHGLSDKQRKAQPTFERTGGLHASALFTEQGELVSLYEDVGRHNALDKLIGNELLHGRVPLNERILFLSGRASFELIQKSAMAGIPFVAAVGAPSSLAVSLARQCSMTLLGFVRNGRFNIYSDAGRLVGLKSD